MAASQQSENLTLVCPPTVQTGSEKWNQWTHCIFKPGMTASEFLCLWRQARGEVQASAADINTRVPEVLEYWQFLQAVRSHPDMELRSPNVALRMDPSRLMDLVYDKFLDFAGDLPAQKQSVVFLARSSSGTRAEKDEYLRWSLQWTKNHYERQYGTINSQCEFFTFVHSSNKPFRPMGEVCSFFATVRASVEKYDGKLLLIKNGWDGLTTDRMSFFNLFSHWAERVTLRVYSEEYINEPRRFFQVDVAQVCDVFRGDIAFDVDDPDNGPLRSSTALFIRKFSAISLSKIGLSDASFDLQRSSDRRNNLPDCRNLAKYICEKCGTPFPTSNDYIRHMNHKHKEYADPKPI